MARFRTLDDLNVHDKTVLLRADLNVPVKDGVVTDATRIERLAPTIEALIARGAKIVVISHFGRPKDGPDAALSLRPLTAPLQQAIGGREVAFATDCIGEEAKRVVGALRPGQVALLENLRFHKGEEENSPEFARALAELGDVYVDDAFSAAHRIKRIPVLDGDAPVGIVSRAEVLRALARTLEERPGPTAGDDEIRERILAELAQVSWVPRDGLAITVTEGIVRLDGVILDEKERDALRVAAENVPGVRAVEDRLVWVEPMSGTIIDAPQHTRSATKPRG
jgi:hypothetical protein